MFVAMEQELRRHISTFAAPNFEMVTTAILENDDVKFILWSVISADWDESSGLALLQMIVKEWVKIRGFSLASAWVEKYKVAQKQITQKSKGARKQLISKPKPKSEKTTNAPCQQDASDSD